jgi:gluconate kinase
MNSAEPKLAGWLPISVSWASEQPQIDWRFFGEERLTAPFFDDSVSRVSARPFVQTFRRLTDFAVAEQWAKRSPGLRPDGFIFHMSRCGSTLVAQMLAARDDSVVLSEPPPIDAILSGGGGVSDDQRTRWLRAMMSALGQRRSGHERHLFVKFDSWHIGQLPLIARAFPDTPWIFLYRDPQAVLASHLRQRGAHTVPTLIDPGLFGMTQAEALALSPAAYCARVLGALCAAAGRFAGGGDEIAGRGQLINYDQLPEALFETILPHFAIDVSPEQRTAMQAATNSHSKNRTADFSAAQDAPPLSPDAALMADHHIQAAWHRLESLRMTRAIGG